MDGWTKWAVGGIATCCVGLLGFLNQSKLNKDQFKEFKESNDREHKNMTTGIEHLRNSTEHSFNRLYDKIDEIKKL